MSGSIASRPIAGGAFGDDIDLDELTSRDVIRLRRAVRVGDPLYDPNAPLPSIPYPPSAYEQLSPAERHAVDRLIVATRMAMTQGSP